jgi:hypothetical protein
MRRPIQASAKKTRLRAGWKLTILALLTLLGGSAMAQTTDQTAAGGPADGQEFTQAGEGGAALPEITVEAENKVRQQIQKGAFSFELDAALVDSFFTAMDEEALGISPVSGLRPHLNNLEKLASDQPPHCWLRSMSRAPMVTFFPQDPEGHKVQSWQLTITDFRGAPFKTFTDKNQPPASLAWDGRGDHGEMLKVGYPYSYVFGITDKGTNSYNYAGVSFRLPALDFGQDGNRLLELAGGELFQREQAKLTDRGHDWLIRATDEIRCHPYSPIRVVVVAESLPLAEQRADAVASFLATNMILPREQVETAAEQKPDLRAELDGTVRIVIEHAD